MASAYMRTTMMWAALLQNPSMQRINGGGIMQVLYLEHSVESLARGGPWLLGTIVPGISRWRVLKEAETEVHGGSSRRTLYGCAVTMLQPQAPLEDGRCAVEGAGDGWARPGPLVFEQLLLTWSQVSLQKHSRTGLRVWGRRHRNSLAE
jgi:hypothetical protein